MNLCLLPAKNLSRPTMINKAFAMKDEIVTWRREFHMHPELGFHEIQTSARIAEITEQLGCRVRVNVGKTGVVAELGSGTPIIALRADMDALPIQELNNVDYKSQNLGVMHACGHDSHAAMLLGAVSLLAKEKFTGIVRFLFQPSEEVGDDEGVSGAPRMIEDGVLAGVDMILALHVDPATAVGDIRVEEGPASGGVDSWFGTILGKGGHGAKPHETIDPIYIAAHVIFAVNAIISRKMFAFDPAVVSIGSIQGGQAENVIPDRIEISGTLRYTQERVQKQLQVEIRRAFEIACSLGGNYDLYFEIGTPPMRNHADAVQLIRQTATDIIGKEHVLSFSKDLGAEDFGCFSEVVPGAMFLLGARIEGNERYGHNPHFDIDERALPIGSAILAGAASRFLLKRRS
jgi:amidohydrolase